MILENNEWFHAKLSLDKSVVFFVCMIHIVQLFEGQHNLQIGFVAGRGRHEHQHIEANYI